MLLAMLDPAGLSVQGPNSLYVYGGALAALIAVFWALLERSERKQLQAQNNELSMSLLHVTEMHYSERSKAAERHLLERDSSARQTLEHLERILFDGQKG